MIIMGWVMVTFWFMLVHSLSGYNSELFDLSIKGIIFFVKRKVGTEPLFFETGGRV
jgi:hypothetical protein